MPINACSSSASSNVATRYAERLSERLQDRLQDRLRGDDAKQPSQPDASTQAVDALIDTSA
ncbi:MAG: hypothetical protein Q8O79_01915 [Pseudomonadota bacterium]|nr:hypothetical protein [Pseudomonadota bacterium]